MAVFTEVTQEEVAGFLRAYGLPAPDSVTGITEGIENTNYKVLTGGTRFILTLYEKRVAVEDLPYFLALMEETAEAGLPAPRPVRAENGDRLRALKGRPAALIEFLPGRATGSPAPDDARRAGAFLARFHRATTGSRLHRPNGMGLGSWRAMAFRAGRGLDRYGTGVALEVQRTIRLLSDLWPSGLPGGPAHTDLFPDNLLLDHGEVSGIIDFYFACTELYAYDLAVSMNAYTPEQEPLDFANARALQAGYDSVYELTERERDALPVLLCGSALRFFLTRATDDLFAPEGAAVYEGKDPLPWLRLMRHHRAELEDSG